MIVTALALVGVVALVLAVHHDGASRTRRLLARLREFNATQIELQERMLLRNQPWEEDLLHYCHDGRSWQVHGHLIPPADGRRHSTTQTGWCPGDQRTRPVADTCEPTVPD